LVNKAQSQKVLFLVFFIISLCKHNIKVPQSTAQSWMKKANQAGDDDFEERKSGSGRPVGRPPILGLEHKEFLTNLIDEKPSTNGEKIGC
jgi:hypothetical protein